MNFDIDKLLDSLPLGSYILTKGSNGELLPILVYADDQEWCPDEMPFTLPTALAA